MCCLLHLCRPAFVMLYRESVIQRPRGTQQIVFGNRNLCVTARSSMFHNLEKNKPTTICITVTIVTIITVPIVTIVTVTVTVTVTKVTA